MNHVSRLFSALVKGQRSKITRAATRDVAPSQSLLDWEQGFNSGATPGLRKLQGPVSTPGSLWANRISAATAGNGAMQWFSDIGPAGSLLKSDGAYWRPVNGRIILWAGNSLLASPLATLTANGAAQSFVLPGVTASIPAGLLFPGCTVQVRARARRLGAAGVAGSMHIRIGNSGSLGIADNIFGALAQSATTNLDMILMAEAPIVSATAFLGLQSGGSINGAGVASAFVDRTTSFDTTGANLVSIGIPAAMTVDQIALLSYEIAIGG